MDITKWYDDGAGMDSSVESWEDEERLVLGFTVVTETDPTLEADDYIRCLACLNVDENSELRDGDKGFAACYYVYDGDLTDFTTGLIYQFEEPNWFFMDTVEVTNKGNALKATENEAWETSFTWGKWNDCANEYLEDVYQVASFHYSDGGSDKISIVSKEGFKGVGLKNGENHLKCYYTSGADQANEKTVATAWEPSFGEEDGESLVGWTSTGVAQLVHLKDANKSPLSVFETIGTSPWEDCV